jgi:hypothetical protein
MKRQIIGDSDALLLRHRGTAFSESAHRVVTFQWGSGGVPLDYRILQRRALHQLAKLMSVAAQY